MRSDIAAREHDFAVAANLFAIRFSYSGNSLERSMVPDVLDLCSSHHDAYQALAGRTEVA
jgi:hypothetical protein